jgi:hypothetical protein
VLLSVLTLHQHCAPHTGYPAAVAVGEHNVVSCQCDKCTSLWCSVRCVPRPPLTDLSGGRHGCVSPA